jgi:hypothetical protein
MNLHQGNVNCKLASFLEKRNVEFDINIITGTLSHADGSATTMLFTHGCSKGSKFSTHSQRK